MIRQRVLYVGIGGTGLDLGVHLHEALQREICGPDGRALNRLGSFAQLEPNQLPSFVQNLLIDFNVAALNGAEGAMSGGNITIARSVQPALNNYPAVATQLRMRNHSEIKNWIPDPPPAPLVEPAVKPYTAGAGQYPTIGRAALFSAMATNGYGATIGNDIQNALKKLGTSLGDLSAYSVSRSTKEIPDIAVYVGFSLSGGTGAGLFVDVLQLLIHELELQLSGNRATIIPIVYLPSTFDGVLNPSMRKRAELNCAQGILDLHGLVASRQQSLPALQDLFTISYPGDMKISNASLGNGSPSIPVISVVRKSAGMSKEDLGRAVAASVVAQLSYDAQIQNKDDNETANGFSADLINRVSDISRPHVLGLGTHALMPMIASSLTVPTQRISDIIAKKVLVRGMAEQQQLLSAGHMTVDEEAVNNFLRQMGFGKMVDVETYQVDQGLRFEPPSGIKSESELSTKLSRIRNTVANNLSDTKSRIERDVRGLYTFNFAETFEDFMASNRTSGMSIVNALNIAQRALDRLEFHQAARSTSKSGSPKTTDRNFITKILPKRVSAREIAEAFAEVEKNHRRQVEEIWWDAWNSAKPIWTPSLDQGRAFLDKVKKTLSRFGDELDNEIRGLANELEKSDNGVVFYVPTAGLALEAQINVIENDALERVRSSMNITNLSIETLFSRVVSEGEGWEKAIELLRTDAPLQAVHEAILEPIRTRIQEAIQPRDGSIGAMKGLPELLKLAVSVNGQDSEDTRSLIQKLGNLVPGQMLPTGAYQHCRVLVTYPGEESAAIEEFIKKFIAVDGQFAQILADCGEQSRNSLEFVPTGRGDTIRVNINMIGQGLLDNPEIKAVLKSWVSEVGNTASEGLVWRQRLGYETVGRVFNAQDRDKVVAAIIRGLVTGQVEIVEGSVEHPKTLKIRHSNSVQSKLVDTFVSIDQLDNLSAWPNVVNGFEKLILSIDVQNDFRSDVIESLNVSGIGQSNDGLSQIPDVIYDLVEVRDRELPRVRKELETPQIYSPEAKRRLEAALEFWDKTFDQALDVPISTAGYVNIRTAMSKLPRASK
jgi:hypothetical protein